MQIITLYVVYVVVYFVCVCLFVILLLIKQKLCNILLTHIFKNENPPQFSIVHILVEAFFVLFSVRKFCVFYVLNKKQQNLLSFRVHCVSKTRNHSSIRTKKSNWNKLNAMWKFTYLHVNSVSPKHNSKQSRLEYTVWLDLTWSTKR